MTTGAVMTAPPAPGVRPTPGVTTGDTSGLSVIRGLFGGPGTARWKALLPGSWKIIEYTELLPGSGCGRQLSPCREEAYFIVSGAGMMTVNDAQEIPVSAGDLICCPAGTIHGIRVPASAPAPMAYLVVKLPPAIDAPHGSAELVPMMQRLDWTAGFRGEGHHSDVRVAAADLRNLTGTGWRRLSLIEIPPAAVLGPYELPVRVSEILFVTSGSAEITVGTVTARGQAGLFAVTPLRARCQVRNLSAGTELYLLSAEVSA